MEHWLSRLAPGGQRSALCAFRLFMRHMGTDAEGLLRLQREAKDQYEVLNRLQEFISGYSGRRTAGSMRHLYGSVRSFYLHNRCALPEDPSFKMRSEKVSPSPRLSVETVRDLVKAADLRDRSIILVKWQAMLDNARLVYLSNQCGEQIVEQMRKGVHPVRLDLPRRKSNEKGWYGFIGKDSVDALREYFEKERGWPKPGEAIWLRRRKGHRGNALTEISFQKMWLKHLRRIGLIPRKPSDVATRYGYNPHEMRDVAKSMLHTNAKKDGFDMDCCEFWLGHTVDKLGYDKFYHDQEYVKKQYLIAEKYLNILSVPPVSEQVEQQEEEMKKMQDRLASLEAIFSEKLKIK